MGTHITTFSDGSFLEYDRGKFDDYCVFITDTNNIKTAPLDIDYFKTLSDLGIKYGVQKVYSDFVTVYNSTSKAVDATVFATIKTITQGYSNDMLLAEKTFTILYCAMIAEENKKYTKLGKRIKRLGVHQVLFENITPSMAANFSKGKPWRDLDSIMLAMGF